MKNDKAKKERADKAAASASAKGKAKEVDPNASSASASVSMPMPISSSPKSKGKAPVSSGPAEASISASVSTPGAILPSPFTSAPLVPAMPVDAELPSQPHPQMIHGDNDEMDVEEEGAEDEDEDLEVDVDEVAEGGEEIQDVMVVEEEEIRRDAKGLEERVTED